MQNGNKQLNPILLSIQMFVDDFEGRKWSFVPNTMVDMPCFSGCNIYCGQKELFSDIVYFIPANQGNKFPKDRFSYITSDDICGKAPHIRCIKQDDTVILNVLMDLFQKYKTFESDLTCVITSGGSLNDLCQVGIDFLHNPMYVHDNLFCILALPQYVKGMREFDYDKETGKSYIPLWLINDFKFDDEYQKTLVQHKACMWGNEQYPRDARCAYVNIWDGTYYIGRLMLEELKTTISPSQLTVLEYMGEYARYIMVRDSLDDTSKRHDYESTFRNIVNNIDVKKEDINNFMSIMGWSDNDDYLCIKTISQEEGLSVRSESSLRSKYSELFSNFFSFYNDGQCCILVNMTKSQCDFESIGAKLAPLIRESYLYAGISNVFSGMNFVYQGFRQAEVALSMHNDGNDKWINFFNQCVLKYLIKSFDKEFSADMVVAPGLIELIEQDKVKHSDNYRTLKLYLENERNISKTSDMLSIHRTTLLYRLEKIGEILKMNIDDGDTRLYLLICFKIIEKII